MRLQVVLPRVFNRWLEGHYENLRRTELLGKLVCGERLPNRIFAFHRKRGTACMSSFQIEWK